MSELQEAHFGPILHVIRYETDQLDRVIWQINQAEFGLTLGIHSRSGYTVEYIEKHVKVGHIYVNRNQIGAIVGGLAGVFWHSSRCLLTL